MATPRKTPVQKTNFAKEKYQPLPACGSLDTPYKIRALMRRVISHQLKGELSPPAQSAINGSAAIALKTLELGEFEDRINELEKKIEQTLSKKHKKKKQKGGTP